MQCAPSLVKVVYCVNAGTSSRTSPSSDSIAALAVCVNRYVVAVSGAACCAAGAVLMCCRSSSRKCGSKTASRAHSFPNAVLYVVYTLDTTAWMVAQLTLTFAYLRTLAGVLVMPEGTM